MASLLNAKNAVAQKICRGAKTIALGYMDNAAPLYNRSPVCGLLEYILLKTSLIKR